MFQSVKPAAPDAILGLNEAFKADSNAPKVNLTVGIYANAEGETPVLKCVKAAEQILLEKEPTKRYLGIDGHPRYAKQVPDLLLGAEHAAIVTGRVVSMQTPGGTGALRVAGDWLSTTFPGSSVWLSTPTWPNHPSIFSAARVETNSYAYYDTNKNEVDFSALCESLSKVPAHDVVLLHGCCHNPTGADLNPEQWQEIAAILKKQQALPLVDFAYQGFGESVDEDATGLRILAAALDELIICSSFSKNFGLYRERVGALTVVAGDDSAASAVLSRLKKSVRANYSNPPSHGASIVSIILDDESLRTMWLEELAEMRTRINSVRGQLASIVTAMDFPGDFEFMNKQRGMFSLTGLTPDQVQRLRDERSVYIVSNGRLNLAGLNEQNVQYVAESIVSLLS